MKGKFVKSVILFICIIFLFQFSLVYSAPLKVENPLIFINNNKEIYKKGLEGLLDEYRKKCGEVPPPLEKRKPVLFEFALKKVTPLSGNNPFDPGNPMKGVISTPISTGDLIQGSNFQEWDNNLVGLYYTDNKFSMGPYMGPMGPNVGYWWKGSVNLDIGNEFEYIGLNDLEEGKEYVVTITHKTTQKKFELHFIAYEDYGVKEVSVFEVK